eukprot:evm.model.NODE_31219_length_13803_cov_23.737955.6
MYGCQLLSFDGGGRLSGRLVVDPTVADNNDASGACKTAFWLPMLEGGREGGLHVCLVMEHAVKVFRVNKGHQALAALTHCYRTSPLDPVIFDAIILPHSDSREDGEEEGRREGGKEGSSLGIAVLVLTKGLQLLKPLRTPTGGTFFGRFDASLATALPLPPALSLDQLLHGKGGALSLHISPRLELLLLGTREQAIAFPVNKNLSSIGTGFQLLSPAALQKAKEEGREGQEGREERGSKMTSPLVVSSSSMAVSSLSPSSLSSSDYAYQGPYLRFLDGPSHDAPPCVLFVARNPTLRTERVVVLSRLETEKKDDEEEEEEKEEGGWRKGDRWVVQDLVDVRTSSKGARNSDWTGDGAVEGFCVAAGAGGKSVVMVLQENGSLSLYEQQSYHPYFQPSHSPAAAAAAAAAAGGYGRQQQQQQQQQEEEEAGEKYDVFF